jgi:hypothetical protein
MAELSSEIHETLWILKKQLLAILDKAKATEDMVAQAISRIQQRVPALERSIEEIRSDWGLK